MRTRLWMHSEATSRVMRTLPSSPGGVVSAPISSAFSAARASPLAMSARKATASPSASTPIRPSPLSGSASALPRIFSSALLSSGRSSKILERETRARFTSKYGFSVVAPMSVRVPSSTKGRR